MTELRIPAPTGPHRIGRTTRHLNDTSRRDPWVADAPTRELMVSLWYPTTATQGPRAQYLTAEESALFLADANVPAPGELLAGTRTNAIAGAGPAPGPHPLVLLSPGFTKPRGTLTGLAEELASHGYLAAVVDHAYENVGMSLPDGRVLTCRAREIPRRGGEFWAKLVAGRGDDLAFVLSELLDTWPIDPARIAVGGHSVGGASAIAALLREDRFRVGFDIDGSTHVHARLDRPFLFLGKQLDAESSWDQDWPDLTGWRRWLVVPGANHASFTDVALLAEQLGLDPRASVPAARVHAITRACVLALVEQHLREIPQPLFDGPTEDWPELAFRHQPKS